MSKKPTTKERQEQRFTWKPGDVVIYKSVDDLKRQAKKEGKTFIPTKKRDG